MLSFLEVGTRDMGSLLLSFKKHYFCMSEIMWFNTLITHDELTRHLLDAHNQLAH